MMSLFGRWATTTKEWPSDKSGGGIHVKIIRVLGGLAGHRVVMDIPHQTIQEGDLLPA